MQRSQIKNISTLLIFISSYKERYNNNEPDKGDWADGLIFAGYSIPSNAFEFGIPVAL